MPFTLQTFAVFLAIGTLGGKRGSICVLVYLLLGIEGLPVFAGFNGGLGALLSCTGGYLIGFILSALTMWIIEKILGKNMLILGLSMVIGLIICYTFGTAWYIIFFTSINKSVSIGSALLVCVVPFIIPDLIKIALALTLSRRLSSVMKLNNAI